MTGASFRLHPAASEDILEIWQFIATDSLGAATRFREEILDAIRLLVSFPLQGHIRQDLTDAPLRFRIVREYLIAYLPEEKPLVILAVFHGRRNPRIIAAMLRERKGSN